VDLEAVVVLDDVDVADDVEALKHRAALKTV
jgi:hypothetical protein